MAAADDGPVLSPQQQKARAAISAFWQGKNGDDATAANPRMEFDRGTVTMGFSGSHYTMAVPQDDNDVDLTTLHHTVLRPAAAPNGDTHFTAHRASLDPETGNFGAFTQSKAGYIRPGNVSDAGLLDAMTPRLALGGVAGGGVVRDDDVKPVARALKSLGAKEGTILGHNASTLNNMSAKSATGRMRSTRRLSVTSMAGGRPQQT